MQDFHVERARTRLQNAEDIFDAATVQQSVARVAGILSERFNRADDETFPLVLGVMGGAVVFVGQ